MAEVPIPWFGGFSPTGENLYAGKAERSWRQLRSLEQGMYGLGTLLRKQRSKGLPPGWTDDDLEAYEQKLEAETQNAQAKVRHDTTHGVEKASTDGDPSTVDAIKSDPAGYAAEKHEQRQGLLPQLGNFMVQGTKRLLFGDPRRQGRLSHIRQMQGELQAEKDREGFLKTVGATCMKTEDPDACLREMGGGRFGLTHLPKMMQKPTAAQQAQQPDEFGLPPPLLKGGGGLTNSMDYREAERRVRDRNGGHMPPDAASQVYAELERIRQGREAAKLNERDRHARSMVDYKAASIAARQAQRDAIKAAAAGGQTVSESWVEYKDVNNVHYQFDEAVAARLNAQYPVLGLTKVTVRTSGKRPAPVSDRPVHPPDAATGAPSAAPQGEPDPGDEWGVKFYAPLRDERGGQ